jgi:hypothetical protein
MAHRQMMSAKELTIKYKRERSAKTRSVIDCDEEESTRSQHRQMFKLGLRGNNEMRFWLVITWNKSRRNVVGIKWFQSAVVSVDL